MQPSMQRFSPERRATRALHRRLLGAPLLAGALVLLGGLAASGLAPSRAHALPDILTLRLQVGLGVMLTTPQLTNYPAGFGGTLGAEIKPIPELGFEPRFSLAIFPNAGTVTLSDGFAGVYSPGLAIRVHPAPAFFPTADVWGAIGGAVAFTGSQIFPSMELSAGMEFEMETWLRVGPYIRFTYVFDTNALAASGSFTQVNAADSGYLTIGISGAFLGREPEEEERNPWEAAERGLPGNNWHEERTEERRCTRDDQCEEGESCRVMRLSTCARCPRGELIRVCQSDEHPGESIDTGGGQERRPQGESSR